MKNAPEKPTESQPRWMTCEQAAAYLQCSPATLNKDRLTGLLQVPYCRMGRSIRYDRLALDAYLEGRAA
jgi:hypothetical protein